MRIYFMHHYLAFGGEYLYEALVTNKKEDTIVLALNTKDGLNSPFFANYLNSLSWNKIRHLKEKKVSLEDLPLYINWKYKSPEFLDLIKRGL